MKRHKVKYTDEPIGKINIIADFLPPPEKLVMREQTVQVTFSLNKATLAFFKQVAKKNHTHYQKMLKAILDRYADHFSAT
jgi:hypothetical protein